MAKESVHTQFATVSEAARGCDLLLAGGALQVAAHSVAEALHIPYVYTSYCPVTLPSHHHAPLPLTGRADQPTEPVADNRALWDKDAQRWTAMWGPLVNPHRTAVGLPPIDDVRRHIFTDSPWLAADPILAPWPEPGDRNVFQTGAWILPDRRPLPSELTAFLEAGPPPVYFGFGTMGVAGGLGRLMVEAARALGRRAILFGGWNELAEVDDGGDRIVVGDVNQQVLFEGVAAVVHHGGAGTTTTVARAGAPQVVVPQMYDQFYWGKQVERLGIGTVHPAVTPTVDSLASALRRVLVPEVSARARSIAPQIHTEGTRIAADRLISIGSS